MLPTARRALAPASIAAGTLLLVAHAFPAAARTTPHPAPDRPAAQATSSCTSIVSRTIAPDAIRDCERSDVSIRVAPGCPGEPLDVVLVIGGYGELQYERQWEQGVVQWTLDAIEALDLPGHPNIRVGIVYGYAAGTVLLELTNDEREVLKHSRVMFHNDYWAANLCWPCIFRLASDMLASGNARRNAIVFIGIMWHMIDPEHPHYTEMYYSWFKATAIAKAAANPFVIGCPSPNGCKWESEWWKEASPGYYFEGANSGAFAGSISRLAKRTMPAEVAVVSLDDVWPTGLDLVPGSAAPAPATVDAASRRVRWDVAAPITRALTLTYQVRPLSLGVHTFDAGRLVITDTLQKVNTLPVPTGALTVTGPCIPPTPTPTDTPPATATATATDTARPATPTATTTPTPRPTVTPEPRPVYLPLLLREQCVPGRKRMDVVLAIDASTSMLRLTGAGRTKLAAAQEAASAFVEAMRLEEGDQAAIVAFSDAAPVVQTLTSDRRALAAALAGIAVAQTTRLDLAVASAHAELTSARHVGAHAAAMIVLTDGKANPVGPEVAVANARQAKDAGIAIFTVGLGDELDVWALEAMASRPSYFHRAPDGEDLRAIYRAIAVEIPCPAADYWGGR